ncbi:PA14 domain-containing protein [Candidatus Leptofilum sp.]|uniref:PA14 domain-containing protein n=1 Tax=Candidatus Leptofilum sp. TaxID=3241576 RepID=UPI003B5BEF1E
MSIKRVAMLFLWLVTAVFILSATNQASAATSWTAKYYNNRDLSGTPVITVSETNLDHDWGTGSPNNAINVDNFSAEWTRNLYFAPGNYRFIASMDDGMRVFVDNNPIIDVWYDSQAHTVTADIYLNGGHHDIRVEYYEAGGNALARVNWALVSGGSALWRGDYYNNTSLSGAPVLSRDEAQINYNWSGSPGSSVNADLFSVRWTSNLSLDAGVYRFTVTADDGVRLWVNNQLIIDQWREQPATSFTADISVADGFVPVKMEYYENGGTAVAALTWAKISGVTTPAPPSPIISDWRGEYYNNRDLAGSPVVVRNDSAIDFIWGSSSPIPNAINSDHFSVRWTQTVNLAAGNYVFTANTDDGVRVWVNGQQLIDAWDIHDVQLFAGAITLPGGPVEIRMEYFEYSGLAEARLSWTTANGTQPTGQGMPTTATMSGAVHLTVRSGPGLSNHWC